MMRVQMALAVGSLSHVFFDARSKKPFITVVMVSEEVLGR